MHKGADLFYKCRFQTMPAETLEDPLWTLVLQIRKWICRKHRDLPYDTSVWTREVKYGGELRNADGTVHIKSRLYCLDDSAGLMWACRIEEFSEGKVDGVTGTKLAGQTWTTEIGYKESGEERSGEISILLSYFNEPYFIGRTTVPPTPNVPKIVRLITRQRELGCNVSGMPIQEMLIGVEASKFESSTVLFWSRVNDPHREYPMVYIGKDARGDYAVDPEALNSIVFPNALVCYPSDGAAAQKIADSVPVTAKLITDGINVFFPSKEGRTRTRQFGFGSAQLDAMRRYAWENGPERKWWGNDAPDPILLMLRRALAEDVRFSESGELITVDDVIAERGKNSLGNRVKAVQAKLDEAQRSAEEYSLRLEALRKESEERRKRFALRVAEQIHAAADNDDARKSESQKLMADLQSAQKTIEMLQQNNESLGKDNEDAYAMAIEADDKRKEILNELEETKQSLFEATQQLEAYHHGDFETADDAGVLAMLMQFDLPDILSKNSKQVNGEIDLRLVEIFQNVYSSRIRILPDACKGCVTKPSLIWQGLLCMCVSVYEIYAQGRGSGSPEVRLKQDSRVPSCFELALSEGSNTNRNPKLVKLREVEFEGRTLDITPHLKAGHGKDSENTLRIYYCWDKVTERLIIGHIGTHLTNDTSLKNKF